MVPKIFFNTNVKTLLFYGAITWHAIQEISVRTFVIKSMAESRKPKKKEKLEGAVQYQNTCKLTWVRLRKKQDSLTGQALLWNPQSKRMKGRHKTNWKRLRKQEERKKHASERYYQISAYLRCTDMDAKNKWTC